jgi:hypothetical protein
MICRPRYLLCLLCLICRLLIHAGQPDPFWPFGFQPANHDPHPVAQPAVLPDEPVRALTREEIEARLREESENIRARVKRTGTLTMAGNIYAYVQERWVTIGDSVSVTVGGQEYRLLITRLTTNDILLEPHRIPSTTINPGTRP